MSKKIVTATMTAVMVMAATTTSFAGGWLNGTYRQARYGMNFDNSELAHGWQWIVANEDGTALCYYFDENGYVVKSANYYATTTTPDGYTVDYIGAWIENGVRQERHDIALPNYTSQMEPAVYDSYGVNPVAKEMLLNARQGDYNNQDAGRALNAKYGEVYVQGDWSYCNAIRVDYANGFSVNYDYHLCTTVSTSYGIDKSYLFKYYKKGLNADAAAKHLQNNGFAKGINGVFARGVTCWAETGDMTCINWSDDSIVLR